MKHWKGQLWTTVHPKHPKSTKTQKTRTAFCKHMKSYVKTCFKKRTKIWGQKQKPERAEPAPELTPTAEAKATAKTKALAKANAKAKAKGTATAKAKAMPRTIYGHTRCIWLLRKTKEREPKTGTKLKQKKNKAHATAKQGQKLKQKKKQCKSKARLQRVSVISSGLSLCYTGMFKSIQANPTDPN